MSKIYMVWLQRSLIPVGRRGTISSLKWFYLPWKGEGVSNLWICLILNASEGVPYHLAEPRADKPVIESKHQLRDMPDRSSVISEELQAGGNSICLCLTGVLLWPPKQNPGQLESIFIIFTPPTVTQGSCNCYSSKLIPSLCAIPYTLSHLFTRTCTPWNAITPDWWKSHERLL